MVLSDKENNTPTLTTVGTDSAKQQFFDPISQNYRRISVDLKRKLKKQGEFDNSDAIIEDMQILCQLNACSVSTLFILEPSELLYWIAGLTEPDDYLLEYEDSDPKITEIKKKIINHPDYKAKADKYDPDITRYQYAALSNEALKQSKELAKTVPSRDTDWLLNAITNARKNNTHDVNMDNIRRPKPVTLPERGRSSSVLDKVRELENNNRSR